MQKFNFLPLDKQTQISNKYRLPKNTQNVFVDEHNRPFIKKSYGWSGLTINRTQLIDNGFHNYINKQI